MIFYVSFSSTISRQNRSEAYDINKEKWRLSWTHRTKIIVFFSESTTLFCKHLIGISMNLWGVVSISIFTGSVLLYLNENEKIGRYIFLHFFRFCVGSHRKSLFFYEMSFKNLRGNAIQTGCPKLFLQLLSKRLYHRSFPLNAYKQSST